MLRSSRSGAQWRTVAFRGLVSDALPQGFGGSRWRHSHQLEIHILVERAAGTIHPQRRAAAPISQASDCCSLSCEKAGPPTPHCFRRAGTSGQCTAILDFLACEQFSPNGVITISIKTQRLRRIFLQYPTPSHSYNMATPETIKQSADRVHSALQKKLNKGTFGILPEDDDLHFSSLLAQDGLTECRLGKGMLNHFKEDCETTARGLRREVSLTNSQLSVKTQVADY